MNQRFENLPQEIKQDQLEHFVRMAVELGPIPREVISVLYLLLVDEHLHRHIDVKVPLLLQIDRLQNEGMLSGRGSPLLRVDGSVSRHFPHEPIDPFLFEAAELLLRLRHDPIQQCFLTGFVKYLRGEVFQQVNQFVGMILLSDVDEQNQSS